MSTLKPPVGPEDHVQGPPTAPLTLVEYGDYECPYCGAAFFEIKKVQRHFAQRLRFAFRNFPLTQIHPNSEFAAETAEFAGAHKKFWELHDLLYENQSRLGVPLFGELAAGLDLNASQLADALGTHQYLPRIRADFSSGVRSGVNGTPTFFINGNRYEGAYEAPVMIAALEKAAHGQSRSARG
jgi:protein-disulfide isomerase